MGWRNMEPNCTLVCAVTQTPSCSVEPEGMKMYGVWVYPMGILIHFIYIFFKTAGDER